jgi:hypothetical protein
MAENFTPLEHDGGRRIVNSLAMATAGFNPPESFRR